MSAQIRAHIRNNVYGIVALFLVLTGGTAMATHPNGANTISSADIINGDVQEADIGHAAVASAEIKNDSILARDIAPGALTSGRIADGTLTGIDVANGSLTGVDVVEDTLSKAVLQRRVGSGCPSGQAIRAVSENGGVTCQALTGSSPLGPAGGDLRNDYPNPAIRANAVGSAKVADDSLTGDDVAEPTLDRVPSAQLGGFGRSGSAGLCNPESGAFVVCATTPAVHVPQGAAALVLGHVSAATDAGADSGIGDCRLGTSTIGAVPNTTVTFRINGNDLDNGTLVGITPPLPAGSTSFGIDCQDASPVNTGISFYMPSATAVLITDG